MDNVLQTTTVGASVNQFFDSEAQEVMERQLQVLASIGTHAIHLARLFVHQYREHSMRASGNYDIHNSESKRKSNVHRTANPQKGSRLPVEQQPNYRDPDENLFFVAINPNHSNLCGWTAGSFRNSAPVFERSGLLLNPKERRLNHPPPLTQATPNTYSAQSFQEYLIEISLPYVSESEEEPEYASIMSGNLQRGARKKLRRNKFDFFIRRQKRITSFINKIKRLSEGRNTIVWFGNGGGGPSRQSVKSPRKRFLKQIKKHFESVKVGDEFMTSAKVNCCKVFHRKIYHDDGQNHSEGQGV
ncbi:hypothetical protein P9112_003486 [Eukaryota sp. TZLM1-RC]